MCRYPKRNCETCLNNVEVGTLLLYCERGSDELPVADRGDICDTAGMSRDTGTSFIV